MTTVLALGDAHELEGFALTGVRVLRATDPGAVTAAWQTLDPDVGLVVLTTEAARVLGGTLADRPDVLTAVLP